MFSRQWKRCLTLAFAACLAAAFQPQLATAQQLVPERFDLNPVAAQAIDAAWLTEDERRELRVFHGVWDDRDLTSPTLQARVALNAWDFNHPSLSDPSVPAELRAEAKLAAGELDEALALLEHAHSNWAARIRAAALEGLGRTQHADEATAEPVQRMLRTRITDAGELTEGVRVMMIRARIQGQPARDYQTMMDLLARAHQELDRLYWPAKLAEAELLLDKDNAREGIDALHETLALNPRCAQAWYMLGRVALHRFDFNSALIAAGALRRLNSQHPLADLLEIEARLVQDDPDGAMEILTPLLKRLPHFRDALAYNAAAHALYYDEQAMQRALDQYDELSPGSPNAYYIVGRHLSLNRQYEAAAAALEEAIVRQPAWPAPQIELGLMELQSGRDDRALAVLQRVARLDPFHKRAANSLFLLEELASYAQIESDHFIVRYKPGIDEVLAEMMLDELERIHAVVTTRFAFEPPRKTIIELMPDHQRFAVRITGMPFVHTIAACTGPVIAMEAPRQAKPGKHTGLFDWPRVVQHEYTHTVTLAQTRNRIPHWLTEGAAVSMELKPRRYETCLMLAQALETNSLFSLDTIKWAFVRPENPGDRAKAYAIGNWMVEFMDQRFGESALVRLLARYHDGEREQQAIPNALGVSREQFYAEFLEWAKQQVASWGLAARPTITELTDEIRAADPELAAMLKASKQARLDVLVKALSGQIGRPKSHTERPVTADRWPPLVRPPVEISDAQLAKWIEQYPDHPDLAEIQLRRHINLAGDEASVHDAALMQRLHRYATLRPVDPLPHRKLAQLWLASDTPEKAIPHLEKLDELEEKSPVHAIALAKLYRQIGEIDAALAKVTRALHINPYYAPNRELAAAIAIEAQRLDLARQHIVALTKLEPDRPQHQRRLEALDRLIAKNQSE